MEKVYAIGFWLFILFVSVFGKRSGESHVVTEIAPQEGKEDLSLKRDSLYKIVDDYIAKVSHGRSELSSVVLVDACLSYNIDIVFVLSQGHLESHFGVNGIASKTNSVFNVGSYDGLGVERINGKFKYISADYSVIPYLELLCNDYLCNGSVSVYDLMTNYVNYKGQRYASNVNYERDLRSIYNKIDRNTDIRRLQTELSA